MCVCAMHDDLGRKDLEIHKYNLEKTQQKFEKLTETSQEIHKDNQTKRKKDLTVLSTITVLAGYPG